MATKANRAEQTEAEGTVSVSVRFNKTKILGMKRYADRVDLLSVLLQPYKTYTLEAVDTAISDFMKGKVK